jgi:hypothetical protein
MNQIAPGRHAAIRLSKKTCTKRLLGKVGEHRSQPVIELVRLEQKSTRLHGTVE